MINTVLFVKLIRKDGGTGPCEILATWMVLNPTPFYKSETDKEAPIYN